MSRGSGRSLLARAFRALAGFFVGCDYVGWVGERRCARELTRGLFNPLRWRGDVLRNLYVPAGHGETTEVDLVYVTRWGLFVIESKNYSGAVTGDCREDEWVQCFPPSTKPYRFYNPVKQNAGHIRGLRYALAPNGRSVPMFSVVVFGASCRVRRIDGVPADTAVVGVGDLRGAVLSFMSANPRVLTRREVAMVYRRLESRSFVSRREKRRHISYVRRVRAETSRT